MIDTQQVFDLVREPLRAELRTMLNTLAYQDLTTAEIAALVAVLRPPYERRNRPQAELALVRELKPQKNGGTR
ncbi:hypothetical protein [Mycolicibacterium iranicum]|uniref:hypothetical protein n=1 Tax=Mycolicibacterium iranicum TaxID=912594 RepID=UPI000466651D|nr:hypothetical protein [Mycolicibacterium iranicum]